MPRLSRTKRRKTYNYRCQIDEPRAWKALSAVGESAGGSASPKSESRAHVLACGGVRKREDRRVEAHRSLVDAGVPQQYKSYLLLYIKAT